MPGAIVAVGRRRYARRVPSDLVLTERTRKTRDLLLKTARAMFERDGYDAASISAIVEAAEISRGTFYLYFDSKEEIFRTLAEELQAKLIGFQHWPKGLSPEEGVRRAIRMYLAFYRENARMMAVLEQIATYDSGFQALRRDMRRAVAQRATRFIASMQRQGITDPELDARYAGTALTGMIDRFAYVWFILEEDFDEQRAEDTLTRLWFQALGGTNAGPGSADG
jgi:AcrR family transcriptional regulator